MLIEPSFLFKLLNLIAIIGWLFLFLLPNHTLTKKLVLNGFWSLFLALVYIILLIAGLLFSDDLPDFGSIEGVLKAFSSEWGVLTGWVHYLCFDLLIGVWIVEDVRKNKFKNWIQYPSLFFTFLLGPLGFFIYFLFRKLNLRNSSLF